MFCPKCGAQNPEGARICSSCSAVLTTTTTEAPITSVKTSGLAITALVLAILSPFTCFLSAIPAIILGIVSLVKISQSKGQLKGVGMAITGIALPVVLVPFVAILILFPALAHTRQLALRVHCAANMSSLGTAMLIYANDYDDKFPISSKWCDLLIEHAEVIPATFRCKGAFEGPCNYAMNKNLQNFDKANAPPDMVALFETKPGWNQVGGPELLTTDNHQGDGCNILFMDNHVEFVKTRDLDKLKW